MKYYNLPLPSLVATLFFHAPTSHRLHRATSEGGTDQSLYFNEDMDLDFLDLLEITKA